MAKNLVIVESPAKAKTIEGYLGKDFLVMSSYGHVRDLAKKGVAIDIENDFKPNYEIRSEEHTSELQSRPHLVCRLLLEKKKKKKKKIKKKKKKKNKKKKNKKQEYKNMKN